MIAQDAGQPCEEAKLDTPSYVAPDSSRSLCRARRDEAELREPMNELPRRLSAGRVLTSQRQANKEEKVADKKQQGHHKIKVMMMVDHRCHHQQRHQQQHQTQGSQGKREAWAPS